MSVPPQQDAKIIEPRHDPLELHAIDEKYRQRRLLLPDVIEESILRLGDRSAAMVVRPFFFSLLWPDSLIIRKSTPVSDVKG